MQAVGYGRALPDLIRPAACFRLLRVRRLRAGVAVSGQQATAAQPWQHEQGGQQNIPRSPPGQGKKGRAGSAEGKGKTEKGAYSETHNALFYTLERQRTQAGAGLESRAAR